MMIRTPTFFESEALKVQHFNATAPTPESFLANIPEPKNTFSYLVPIPLALGRAMPLEFPLFLPSFCIEGSVIKPSNYRVFKNNFHIFVNN
jgi:hypothetical protein